MGSALRSSTLLISHSFTTRDQKNKEMSEHGGQQPVIIVVQQTHHQQTVKEAYLKMPAVIVGVLQILCATTALATGVGQIAIEEGYFNFGYFGTGIWTAIFFAVSGGLNLSAGCRPNSCTVVAGLVMSIIATISAGILIVFAGLGLGVDRCSYYSWRQSNSNCQALLVLNSLQVIAGIVQFSVGITSSVLSCKATCCRPSREDVGKVVFRADQQQCNIPDLLAVAARCEANTESEGTENTNEENTKCGDETASLPDYNNSFNYAKF